MDNAWANLKSSTESTHENMSNEHRPYPTMDKYRSKPELQGPPKSLMSPWGRIWDNVDEHMQKTYGSAAPEDVMDDRLQQSMFAEERNMDKYNDNLRGGQRVALRSASQLEGVGRGDLQLYPWTNRFAPNPPRRTDAEYAQEYFNERGEKPMRTHFR